MIDSVKENGGMGAGLRAKNVSSSEGGETRLWGQGLLDQSSEWQEELARQNSEDRSCR